MDLRDPSRQLPTPRWLPGAVCVRMVGWAKSALLLARESTQSRVPGYRAAVTESATRKPECASAPTARKLSPKLVCALFLRGRSSAPTMARIHALIMCKGAAAEATGRERSVTRARARSGCPAMKLLGSASSPCATPVSTSFKNRTPPRTAFVPTTPSIL